MSLEMFNSEIRYDKIILANFENENVDLNERNINVYSYLLIIKEY